MKKMTWILAAALVLTLAPAVWALEFSAEVIHSGEGQQAVSKVYVKGGKVRMESSMGDGSQAIQIMRQDRGVMWLVDPSQQGYYEGPLGDIRNLSQPPRIDEKLPGEISRRELAGEKLSGQATRKFEITFVHEGQTQTIIQWYSTALGMPLKTAAKDNSWSVEMRGVVKAPQPDALFELPAGYRPLPPPDMTQQGGYGQ